MNCPHCNAENPAGGKFCRQCGSALTNACRQCGHPIGSDDRYCVSCGQALFHTDNVTATHRSALPAKQYSPNDITELLALRRVMKKEEISSKTLNQDDVDKLFG